MEGLAKDGELPVSQNPEVDFVRVRIAGDSGDGVQMTGTQLAESAARFGNDIATFPDFPSDIRAPSGTVYGVSAYSLNIGHTEVATFGDESDALVALNPAALKKYLSGLKQGGTLVIDGGSFTDRAITKAGFDSDPRENGMLEGMRLIDVDITDLTEKAVKEAGLSAKDAKRCKNMWTLGLILWLFERDIEDISRWIERKFSKKPEIMQANLLALKAGHLYGENAELAPDVTRFHIPPAPVAAGDYRSINGNEAMAYGLYTGATLAGVDAFYGSYPITPASPLLHTFVKLKELGALSFQAEDEIAAVCAALGASYAGHLGITGSSGPGVALKTEALGLAIMTELPLVVVNVQRGGPSTGLPTKTEQSDLYQAVLGRNGDAPMPVIAPAHPGECFDIGVEACRLAVTHMTPVMVLSDGYIANSSQPWKLPDFNDPKYAPFPVTHPTDPVGFLPYGHDPETMARPWAIPGTPELMHRIGGLEREVGTGNISYEGENHHKMTEIRAGKLEAIRRAIPLQHVESGSETGRVAIVGWGSSWGPIRVATRRAIAQGKSVSHIHLRHISPMPSNLKELLSGFDKIIVPEMNYGQLAMLLRAQTGLEIDGRSCVKGRPFYVREISAMIDEALED
ncbi:2-oxoacid:acceptor oxidoreductase subunit alpha [Rhodobacteraceae bacterium RKSG542]|uniref:2-oxoacid:acceptor oxidoreductase subunit alpha n=1 Tax=Pseudovibrio flavus TaxID=2529854 RepID=UPI0012BBBA74|nr:2-oxoacid:acceptor oxidoreductase subunit alpha [Pseudovibrio flavus]MTI16495.1 2-oxoacid:acceptor oxidoreductase subunit alpha [Pseudovibrio flavus]